MMDAIKKRKKKLYGTKGNRNKWVKGLFVPVLVMWGNTENASPCQMPGRKKDLHGERVRTSALLWHILGMLED